MFAVFSRFAIYANVVRPPHVAHGRNRIPFRMFNMNRIPLVLLVTVLSCIASAQTSVALKPIATGLVQPVQVDPVPGSNSTLFVAEQRGRILFLETGTAESRLFLDISAFVDCCDNGGLLSVAFHPNYSENGRLFVLYVNHDGDTVVAEFRHLASNPAIGDPTSQRILLTIDQPSDNVPNHHGGTLRFGPDGLFYVSIGDGGVKQGISLRAQDLHLLLGKLLRIDVDRGVPYGVPADNPFVGNPAAAPEIWAYGLRNPWRFGFDGASGELILGDVGQDSWEELNAIALGASRGANFGWPYFEGSHYLLGTSCNSSGFVMPIAEYSHAEGCSITAGPRYRGRLLSQLSGQVIYADWCAGTICAAALSSSGWKSEVVLQTQLAIVSFGEDAAHELYVVDYNGSVFKVVPVNSRYRAARH